MSQRKGMSRVVIVTWTESSALLRRVRGPSEFDLILILSLCLDKINNWL